jgi:release factor glutamine methyltransferase
VALAHELPGALVFATDAAPAALQVARRNAIRHGIAARIHFLQCNLLDALLHESFAFDLIVSNPPYVGRREAELLPREVRKHEPSEALFGGEQGFDFYGPLISQAEKLLAPGGQVVLEVGYNALDFVLPLFSSATWVNRSVTNDLAGIPRVIAAERV